MLFKRQFNRILWITQYPCSNRLLSRLTPLYEKINMKEGEDVSEHSELRMRRL